jgi:hypothetical protein
MKGSAMIAESFTIASSADSATFRPLPRLERRLLPAFAFRPRLRLTGARGLDADMDTVE